MSNIKKACPANKVACVSEMWKDQLVPRTSLYF